MINTAGLACRGRLEGQDTAYWDAVMKQNVTGTLRVTKTFMPLLRNKKGIRKLIKNISTLYVFVYIN